MKRLVTLGMLMGIFNLNSIMPGKGKPFISRRVFFTGDTALKKGQAVIWDLVPPAGAEGGVGQAVKMPSASYKMPFAGVVLESKDAKTGGQWVDIALPGSVCKCLVGCAVTAGVSVVTFSQNGLFGQRQNATLPVSGGTATVVTQSGTGTAIAIETQSVAAEAGNLVECVLLEGDSLNAAPAYKYQ